MNFLFRKVNGRPIHWRQGVTERILYKPGGIRVRITGTGMQVGKNVPKSATVEIRYPSQRIANLSYDEYLKNGIPPEPKA